MDNLITIPEYAKQKGISKAEAYQQIQAPDMAACVVVVNGIKCLRADSLPADDRTEKKDAEPRKPQKGSINNQHTSAQQTDFIDYLKAQIEELKEENKQKEKQIQDLTEQIAQLVAEQQSITRDALQIANQAQILQALPHQKKKRKGNIFKRLFLRGDSNAEQERQE